MSAYPTKIFWNPDSWLPDTYQEPKLVCNAIRRSLVKRRIYYPYVRAYADAKKFTDEVADEYDESGLFASFETKKGMSDHERLHFMLVDLVLLASADTDRKHTSVIIAKLSQGSEMICRVLGYLRQRDCRVLFALPEVDVATSFGITVSHEQTKCGIPVWLCPDLFNPEWPPQRDSKSYFIEPPEPYAIDFTMPADVNTCVFWDMQDYPLPPGLGLSTFVMNIRSAVQGHVPLSSGGVKIYTYDGADDHGSPVIHGLKYEDGVFHGITVIRNAPADKFARLAKITMDFCLWSMDNYVFPQPRSNLLVISKPWDDYRSSFQTILGRLTCRDHNVFLALPTDQIPPRESYAPNDKFSLLSWELLCATPAADATPRKRRRLSVSH